MADQDTLPRDAKKFLFDQNNFDDDHQDELLEEEPPPPVFSQEELEENRQTFFERGRQAGLAEAAASRETEIKEYLNVITGNFEQLFEQEKNRHDLYEQEVISLCHTIFKSLFPALEQKEGLNEIIAVIKDVLNKQTEHPKIVIEVHSDYKDAVEDHLKNVQIDRYTPLSYEVTANDAMGPADCQMRWENGGSIKDHRALTQQVEKALLENMPEHTPEQHEENSKTNTTQPPQDTAQLEQETNNENQETDE